MKIVSGNFSAAYAAANDEVRARFAVEHFSAAYAAANVLRSRETSPADFSAAYAAANGPLGY